MTDSKLPPMPSTFEGCVIEFAEHLIEKQQDEINHLRSALKNLLDAERYLLGGDIQCVYCDRMQAQDGHAPDCVITQAQKALGL